MPGEAADRIISRVLQQVIHLGGSFVNLWDQEMNQIFYSLERELA